MMPLRPVKGHFLYEMPRDLHVGSVSLTQMGVGRLSSATGHHRSCLVVPTDGRLPDELEKRNNTSNLLHEMQALCPYMLLARRCLPQRRAPDGEQSVDRPLPARRQCQPSEHKPRPHLVLSGGCHRALSGGGVCCRPLKIRVCLQQI